MRVGGQPRIPAALPPGKTQYPLREAEYKLFHSINVTMTDRDVIRRRQTDGILSKMTYVVPECFGVV
jgi:hypothetical protein